MVDGSGLENMYDAGYLSNINNLQTLQRHDLGVFLGRKQQPSNNFDAIGKVQ